jgi:hypothetical protein
MRMLSLAVVVLAPSVLAGCAGQEMPRTYYHWVRPGGNPEAVNADWRDCVGVNSTASRIDGDVIHADAVDPDKATACMKARGWTLDGSRAG